MRQFGFLTGLLCYATQGFAQTTGTLALETLNAYRQPMGLSTLTWQAQLTDAALGHSLYLSALPDRGILAKLAPDGTPEMHRQRIGGKHFTGATLADRTKRQGYGFGASEQVVFSDRNTGASVIDQLMATVYHRSGLLNPAWTQLGGAVDAKDAVIVMGEGASKGGVPQDWLATYPTPMSTVRRIAFQNEIPDPAPDRPGQWLGLPISIHAAAGRSMKAFRFELREHGNPALVPARLLQQSNDARIASNEVFLMPEKPLKYATGYDVQADLGLSKSSASSAGAEARSLRWTFQTPPNPFAIKPVATHTEVIPGNPQYLELVGIEGAWSWETRTSAPQGAVIETQDLGGGKMKINFPATCNTDCKAIVTVKHEGPQPSTERREFVMARSWLANRSIDELLPAPFVQAAKALQTQSAPYALAYGKVGNQWFMSTTSSAANQSSANQSALEGCAKQAAAKGGTAQNCQLYPFK